MVERKETNDTLKQILKSVQEHNEKWDRINEERIKQFDFLNHQITGIGSDITGIRSDIRVLFTKIEEMDKRFNVRFEGIDKRFEEMDKRFDQRFKDIGARIDDWRDATRTYFIVLGVIVAIAGILVPVLLRVLFG